MNNDYLVLIGLGLFGLIILLIIPDGLKLKGKKFWMKIHFVAVYIMILLGIVGVIMLVFDLL